MKKTILVLILLAVGIGAFYLYRKFTLKNPDLTSAKSEFSITADSLVTVFMRDSAAASKKYIDHVMTVTGVVNAVDSQFKPVVISLSTADALSLVQCSMDSTHESAYGGIREGAAVKIKGYCVGYDTQELLGTDVTLNRCVVVK